MDKINSLKKIFYLILLSLIIYSVYWLYASFKFKEEINSIINNNNIITEEIRITGFKQSRLSILTKDGFIERLAFILEGNDVYYKNLIFGDFNKSFSNIIIDGKINYIKKNIEGKFQLSIYDDEGQKKFSSPISINNNKLKILFFELELSKLF